jgi:predicted AAA+ superfamily ATPase
MKKTISQIKEKIRELQEHDLKQILIKLFESMNFLEVTDNHGTQEFGKDIVFYEDNKLHQAIWYACVVKAKDIYQKDFEDVSRQINECFRKSYPSHSKGHVRINKVMVITNYSFKDNAKSQIADLLDDSKHAEKITYWDGGNIAKNMESPEVIDLLFNQNGDLTQNLINKFSLSILNTDSSLKLLETDFNIRVQNIEDFRIKIKAKQKEFEDEREEYLKSAELKLKKLPLKFLPEINELLLNNKPVLLHGIAASGKTTILKKLGKDFIDQSISGYVLFFEISKIKKEIAKKGFSVLINDHFKNLTNKNIELESLDSNKKLLLLLDGLDEIYSEEERNLIISQILKLNAFKSIKVVVSSRNNDYLETNDIFKNNFDKYELLPLSIDEMVDIGTKMLDNSSQESTFVKLIKKNEIIKAFPKTPLTAILLAILFKEQKIDVKELPRSITELYNKFIDVFLNKWDKNKGISEQFKYQERQFVIQKIAEFLQKKGEKSLSEDEMKIFLIELYKERPIHAIKDPEEFISNICERCSIIVKDEENHTFSFFHLTIQEYLTSTIMDNTDEELLLRNYYDDWWLNTNIFYAGKTPHHSDVLKKASEFKINYPGDPDSKLAYIINTTKILQAAHLIDVRLRKKVIISVIKIFDELLAETVKDTITSKDSRLNKKTILELILWSRNLFFEFLGVSQFIDTLKDIHQEIISTSSSGLSDITEYNISYSLAVLQRDANPLYDFVLSKENINPRWYKIVDVDVMIKHLEIPDKKISSKFKSKALLHKDYIKSQFGDRLLKHYTSITGVKK